MSQTGSAASEADDSRPADASRSADPLAGVLADLAVEGAELDALVAPLDEAGWRRGTPAAGWSVAHQIAHLAWTDDVAVLAATDPAAFQDRVRELAAGGDFGGVVDRAAEQGAAGPAAELLAGWRAGRAALAAALRALPAGSRLPWFGPPMAPASMATARLMETWAHGQDVADALGAVRTPTARLRHVAHLAVRTRDFAFRQRGLAPPAEPFRIELTAPGGDTWFWGPEDAAQRVTGPALDLCLLAVRRVHRADTALVATGPDADTWLDVVQAFAGPPGESRAPRTSTAPETAG
jgi:uncharacterized protein (TIGR03084 family)